MIKVKKQSMLAQVKEKSKIMWVKNSLALQKLRFHD